MRIIKPLLLILLPVTLCVFGHAQRISASKKILVDVPEAARGSLTTRLQSYIKAFNSHDIASIFDLVPERAKLGMIRDDFLKQVTTNPEKEYIQSFKILTVKKAQDSEYVDEPTPKSGEGEKWFVSGCQKVSINGAKSKLFLGGFDMWLVDGKWYVRRGGLKLGDGGYQECYGK